MTPEQRDLVMRLAVVPGQSAMANDDFLRAFGAADGKALGVDLLADAIARTDSVDVEMALIVCSRFGFDREHLPLLEALSASDWHQRHEDVASALQQLASPTSVSALSHLATWVPTYLGYDDGRALAVKAIWALGAINTTEATAVLRSLASSTHPAIREAAVRQLER